MENTTKTTARRKSAARTATTSTTRRQATPAPDMPAIPGTISARCIRELLTALWCRLKSDDGIFILLVAVALLLIFSGHGDNGATTACAALLVGSSGGSHVTGEPLTTELARRASPELLRNRDRQPHSEAASPGHPDRPAVALGRRTQLGQHGGRLLLGRHQAGRNHP